IEYEGRESAFDSPRFRDQREIGRCSTVVGSSRLLGIGIRRRKVVGCLARPHEHLTGFIRPVLYLILAGYRLYLRFGIAQILERAEGDEIERVAGRADLAVDF